MNKEPWKKTYIRIWGRCNSSKKYKNYKRYRTIKVKITPKELKCLWFRDKAFLMSKPSIDRIDANGDYTIENCRYLEFIENSKQGGKSSWKDFIKNPPTRKCVRCNRKFIARGYTHKYCDNCRQPAYKKLKSDWYKRQHKI